MKYWKQGFYDEPVEGSVEITEEYYQELLAGQSTGLIIAESKNRHPILVEYEYDIEEVRKMKVFEIQSFDKSINVNSFKLLGKSMWLDKNTRVGLFNSISTASDKRRNRNIRLPYKLSRKAKFFRITDRIIVVFDFLNSLQCSNCCNVRLCYIVAV